jgi:hypothetical protein
MNERIRLGKPVRQTRQVHAKGALDCVLDIAAQSVLDDRKSNFIPRNGLAGEQAHIETFLSSAKLGVDHAASKDHIDLADVRQTEHGIQGRHFDLGVRFLFRFTLGSLLGALADLHKSSGKRPEAGLGLDRATAQQNLIAPLRNASRNNLGIVIMNRLTRFAHETEQIVAGGNFPRYRFSADAAIVHSSTMSRQDVL